MRDRILLAVAWLLVLAAMAFLAIAAWNVGGL